MRSGKLSTLETARIGLGMEDFQKEVTTPDELARVLSSLPEGARIVSDVGASLCSGWGDLKSVCYYAKDNALELIFD